MSTESSVATHYTSGRLEQTILNALAQAGKDPANLTWQDLAAVDEFHAGGIETTKDLAAQMEVRVGSHLLDVGCGIGGPARYFAAERGCKVTGVDLTEEFVQAARSLSRLVKLEHLVEFHQSSALTLPFGPHQFDGAYMIHVGMNIADKAGVYREVKRVLRPGSLFAVFDMMRTGNGPIRYPVPWAATEETSFVTDVDGYREALESAGFRVERERGRGDFAIEWAEQMMARAAQQQGPPALGLHLLMGSQAPVMAKNIQELMREGTVEPIEMIGRAV